MSNIGIPLWSDTARGNGTMVRSGLWLIQEIGLGNVFTKEQHRSAFPGVTQADRRLRDLRAHGWIIHTSLEDVSLNQSEQRFVAIGDAVWDPVARKTAGTPKLTDKARMEVFARSDYQCSICGIAGGEGYADATGGNAVLSAVSRSVIRLDGKKELIFRAECKRCSAGNAEKVEDIPRFLRKVELVGIRDRSVIIKLLTAEKKEVLSTLWQEYRGMSEISRTEVRRFLTQSSPEPKTIAD